MTPGVCCLSATRGSPGIPVASLPGNCLEYPTGHYVPGVLRHSLGEWISFRTRLGRTLSCFFLLQERDVTYVEGLLGTSRVAHHSEVPDTINKAVFVRAIWGGPLAYPGRATLVPLWGDLTPATRKVSRLTYIKQPEEKKPRGAKGQVEQRVKKPAASSSRLCR